MFSTGSASSPELCESWGAMGELSESPSLCFASIVEPKDAWLAFPLMLWVILLMEMVLDLMEVE